MKLSFLIFIIIFSTNAFGQNYIYKGDKQFIATQSWDFKLTNYHWGPDPFLEVSIAKTKTGGYLMLSLEVPFQESISGNIFIILYDGKTVTLPQRIVSDHVDNKSQVLYSINLTQYKTLKSTNIFKIRFSLKEPKGTIGSMIENYTAINKINDYNYNNEINNWNTAKEITELDEEQE